MIPEDPSMGVLGPFLKMGMSLNLLSGGEE